MQISNVAADITSHVTSQSTDDGFRLSASADPEEVSEAFEAVFASMLVKEMRKSLPNGFFGGQQSAVFDGMFDTQFGKAIASNGGLGIGQLISNQMKPNQAAAVHKLADAGLLENRNE